VINLAAVITALTNQKISPLDVNLSGAVIDSRQVKQNNMFVALPGEHIDGHDFVGDAFKRGAAIALIDRSLQEPFDTVDLQHGMFKPENLSISPPLCLKVPNTLEALQKIAAYWRKQHPLRVIGITGSVGKTSTKELTAAILSRKYSVMKNPGNYNNEIGLPLSLLELQPDHDIAVLEMGFYVPGEIKTLCDIAQPQVGVLTNIGTVHAERAGSQDNIARGKAELVQSLPPEPDGIAILNMDDPWVRWMTDQTQAQVFSYGIKEKADLKATDIQLHGFEGVSCQLNHQGKRWHVQSPLLGEFSVYTILRAAASAFVEGLTWQEIQAGLNTSKVEIRMRHYTLPDSLSVLDDTYNASPASTLAALRVLEEVEGRRIAVLGDMLELGIYEQEGHQAVGKYAAHAADVLILVGERSKLIAKTAIENEFPEEQLHWYPNSKQAAKAINQFLHEGDTILVKGSNSMHMDRILSVLEVLT